MNRTYWSFKSHDCRRRFIPIVALGLILWMSWMASCARLTQEKEQAVSMEYEQFLKGVSDQQQKERLIRFRRTFSENDHVFVQEFDKYYEITVTHPSSETATGGAEGYRMDKITGEVEMIWHEHPMPFQGKMEKIGIVDPKNGTTW